MKEQFITNFFSSRMGSATNTPPIRSAMRSILLLFALLLGSVNVWGATYEKTTTIAAGDKVVLVCETATNELTDFGGSSTKYGSGTPYTTAIAGTKVWTIEVGSETGTFSFKNGTDYLYWNSGNSLYINGTKSKNTSWTITIDASGNATIKNANDDTRIIMWNKSSPRFACYAGQSVGTSYYAVQIYKETGPQQTAVFSVTKCFAHINISKIDVYSGMSQASEGIVGGCGCNAAGCRTVLLS